MALDWPDSLHWSAFFKASLLLQRPQSDYTNCTAFNTFTQPCRGLWSLFDGQLWGSGLSGLTFLRYKVNQLGRCAFLLGCLSLNRKWPTASKYLLLCTLYSVLCWTVLDDLNWKATNSHHHHHHHYIHNRNTEISWRFYMAQCDSTRCCMYQLSSSRWECYTPTTADQPHGSDPTPHLSSRI